MASGRFHGRSEMAFMGISPEAIEVLLASTSNNLPEFHVSMVNFEDIHGATTEPSYLHHTDMEETGNDGFDESFNHTDLERKRRLTSRQVQFLEKSFEVESKLEPERKIQLARDLGLQPRQVAIWFQNRRARWKTKQLEKDYDVLKTKHEDLKNDHGRLKKEKEDLMAEFQTLKDKLSKKERESSIDIKQEHVYDDFITDEKKPRLPIEDICSANSVVFDPNSPRCTAEGGGGGRQQYYLTHLEPADSSNRLEPNSWNPSHANDDEGEKVCGGRLPKRELETSGSGLIHMKDGAQEEEEEEEEHPLWSWNY